jgi:hypothetical protein
MSIVWTLVVAVVLTIVLGQIPNKSNVPTSLIVPVLVAGLVKYGLGDWDRGYAWTSSDLVYWASLLGVSYLTLYASSSNRFLK